MPVPRPRDICSAAFLDDTQRLHFLATEGVPGGYEDDEEGDLEEEEEAAIDADEELVRLKKLYIPNPDEEEEQQANRDGEDDDMDDDDEYDDDGYSQEAEEEREVKLEQFRKLIRRKLRRRAIAKKLNVLGFIKTGLSAVEMKEYGLMFRSKERVAPDRLEDAVNALHEAAAVAAARPMDSISSRSHHHHHRRLSVSQAGMSQTGRTGSTRGTGVSPSNSVHSVTGQPSSSSMTSQTPAHVSTSPKPPSSRGTLLPPITATGSRLGGYAPTRLGAGISGATNTTANTASATPAAVDDTLTLHPSTVLNPIHTVCFPETARLTVHWKPSKRSRFPAYPLHWAVMGRSHGALRFLLLHGADPELVVEGAAGAGAFPAGLTARHIAVANGLHDTLRIMQETLQEYQKILRQEEEDKQRIESELEQIKAIKERRKMEREQRAIARREAAAAAAEEAEENEEAAQGEGDDFDDDYDDEDD